MRSLLPTCRAVWLPFSPTLVHLRLPHPGDDGNLSDSDHNDDQNDADPVNVSVRVVALKEIEAGRKDALNDDEGLTPDPVTLQTWLDADGMLRIFVELQGGKSGIVVLEEGAAEESLSLSGSVPNIAATWDGQILSLRGNASANPVLVSKDVFPANNFAAALDVDGGSHVAERCGHAGSCGRHPRWTPPATGITFRRAAQCRGRHAAGKRDYHVSAGVVQERLS